IRICVSERMSFFRPGLAFSATRSRSRRPDARKNLGGIPWSFSCRPATADMIWVLRAGPRANTPPPGASASGGGRVLAGRSGQVPLGRLCGMEGRLVLLAFSVSVVVLLPMRPVLVYLLRGGPRRGRRALRVSRGVPGDAITLPVAHVPRILG